jgi:hypothetical protein
MVLLVASLFATPAGAQTEQALEPESETEASESELDPETLERRKTALEAWLSVASSPRGPCALHALLIGPRHGYAACGESGVWVVRFDDDEPVELLRVDPVDGRAVGLFERDAQLWVEVSSLSAKPVLRLQGPVATPERVEAPPAPSPPTKKKSPKPKPNLESEDVIRPRDGDTQAGQVVAVKDDLVIIDFGSDSGLKQGQRVGFYSTVEEDFGEGVAVSQEQLMAVGVVTNTAPDRAKVRVGMGEHVPVGAVARYEPTARPTASLSAPPRSGGVYEFDVMGRPFVTLEDLGVGIVSNFEFSYRSAGALHLGVLVDPLALGTAEQGGVAAYRALGIAGFDTQYFEAGMGLGIQTENFGSFDKDPGTGLGFSQFARLGAQDGLNLTMRTDVVLIYREFEFSGLSGNFSLPLGRRAAMIGGGGGGSAGYGFGEIGVRILVAGNGGPGSVFIKTTIGGAGVFKDGSCETAPCQRDISYGGPLVGFGATWRFAAGGDE